MNAELKERHGLRRAQCRGRAKVQMQAYGAAIAYNVKKLVAARRGRPVSAADALHPCPRHRVAAGRLASSRPLHVHLAALRQQLPMLLRSTIGG